MTDQDYAAALARHQQGISPMGDARFDAARMLFALANDRRIHPDAKGILFNAGLLVMGMAGLGRCAVSGYEIEPGVER